MNIKDNNLANVGYFGGFSGYYNALRRELTGKATPEVLKEKIFQKVKETIDKVVIANNFNFVVMVIGGQGGKGNFYYPSEYVDSAVTESEDVFGLFVDYCHQHGIKVLLHDLDDNNVTEFGIPVCYELVKKYHVDGFGIERPPAYFGEYLTALDPDLELHAYGCWERYDKPWINWSMSNILERKKMYEPNTVFYMLYCYGGGLITKERCRELTIEAIENPGIEGIVTYFGDGEEMRARIGIVGNLMKEYGINPEKKIIKKEKRIMPDLRELAADKFYVVDMEVSEDSVIHSPVWFHNPKSGWEWMGVVIFPRFTFKPPRWRAYFPKKYAEHGSLTIRLDPSKLDLGRGDPGQIKGYDKRSNFYVDRCSIKSLKVMSPPLPGIAEKVFGYKAFADGMEVSPKKATEINILLN